MPDLGLPPVTDVPLTVVISVAVCTLGLAGLVTGWTESRLSRTGLFAVLVGVAIWVWLWEGNRALDWHVVPESFVEVLARIVR